MTHWLVTGTLVYFLSFMAPATLLFFQIGLLRYVGPRDTLPEPGVLQARARKAADNFRENYPIFMGLGVLTLIVAEANTAQAVLGAQLFVISRIIYLPIYISGVTFLRSGAYLIGFIGLIMMGLSVL